MDPITGAVVAIVIYFVSISAVGVVATVIFGIIGAAIAGEVGGAFGGFLGWAIAGFWGAFAVIQIILEIIHLLQLIAG